MRLYVTHELIICKINSINLPNICQGFNKFCMGNIGIPSQQNSLKTFG